MGSAPRSNNKVYELPGSGEWVASGGSHDPKGCTLTLPLTGLTVVSFEQAVAAPFCTRHLGDLGARVIKVEHRVGGDFTRAYDDAVKSLFPSHPFLRGDGIAPANSVFGADLAAHFLLEPGIAALRCTVPLSLVTHSFSTFTSSSDQKGWLHPFLLSM